MTNYRSFIKGIGAFKQTDVSSSSLLYTFCNWSDKFFANLIFTYNKSNKFFSTNSNIIQNYTLSEKLLIDDREFFAMDSNADCYLKFITSNLKFNLGGIKSNYKNSINDSDLREVKSLAVNYGLQLRSGFKGIFNYHLGMTWRYNHINAATITNSFTDNTSFFDASFVFSEKFNFELQTERYFFGNLDKQSNKYFFMDIECRYVARPNKMTFILSGNNLFNTESFQNYSISDIYISKTEYRLVPRYLLIKIDYRF